MRGRGYTNSKAARRAMSGQVTEQSGTHVNRGAMLQTTSNVNGAHGDAAVASRENCSWGLRHMSTCAFPCAPKGAMLQRRNHKSRAKSTITRKVCSDKKAAASWRLASSRHNCLGCAAANVQWPLKRCRCRQKWSKRHTPPGGLYRGALAPQKRTVKWTRFQ